MDSSKWKYYKHSLIPTTPPHEPVLTDDIEDGTIWKKYKKAGMRVLFARWTSDWDCGRETSWWYVIKDEPFDPAQLKSKRRYEINKGLRYFEVSELDCKAVKEEIFNVRVAAQRGYGRESQTPIDKAKLFKNIDNKWDYYKAYGARFKENGRLCGYSLLRRDGRYINFALQYADPDYEKYGLNAALVNFMLEDHREFLSSGGYICDGSRSVVHETAFQDYLQKYFGFRKAYCRLHISYSPAAGATVKLLYPFRKLICKSSSPKLKQVKAVLMMEEAARNG